MAAPVIRTDEAIEAVYALDKALAELQLARGQPYNWKWAILALHNALQGFMVLALRFTNPALIARVPPALRPWEDELLAAYNQLRLVRDLSDDAREAYLGCLERQWRRSRGVSRAEAQAIVRDTLDRPVSLAEVGYQLVDFSVLFRRIQSPRYTALVFHPTGQPFRPTPQQRADVRLLTSLRNEYMHFTPVSLVRHLEDMPRVVQSCLEVIDFLLGSGGIVWHRAEDEEDLGAKATQLVEDMREEARALAAEYGTSL